MSQVACKKSKFHGGYDITKHATCPWCDPPDLAKTNNNSSATSKSFEKKKLTEMTEEELMIEKMKYGLSKIVKTFDEYNKRQNLAKYETLFNATFGKSLNDEFIKDYESK